MQGPAVRSTSYAFILIFVLLLLLLFHLHLLFLLIFSFFGFSSASSSSSPLSPPPSSPPLPYFLLRLSLLTLILPLVALFPFNSCRWTRNLLTLLSSYNLTVSILCQLFSRFLISCSTRKSHRVLCHSMGLFS